MVRLWWQGSEMRNRSEYSCLSNCSLTNLNSVFKEKWHTWKKYHYLKYPYWSIALLVRAVTGSEAKQKVTIENCVFNTPFALRFAGFCDIKILGPYVKTYGEIRKRVTRQNQVYEPFIIFFI